MHEDRFQFNRGAIRPLQCLVEGWRLVKSDYWFFVAVTFVGVLVAGLAPMYILLGPAMCGIHICLLRQANGQRVKFDMLFQGFNYFGPSFLATLVMMGPGFIFATFYIALMFGGVIGIAAWEGQQRQQGAGPGDDVIWLILAWYFILTIAFVLVSTLLQSVFLFVFPLIVDREMSGWEAVKTSVRAAFANLGGVLTIVLLELMLGLLGVCLCFVGMYFLLPISFAMTAMAYRQVFPVYDRFAEFGPDPESPVPMIAYSKDTGVQLKEPRPTGVKEKTSEGENP